MNSRRNGKKWTLIVLLLALASFATMGFTVVDRGGREVTILVDHVECVLAPGIDGLYLTMDVESRICEAADSAETAADFETSLIGLSVFLVDDSQARFDQYSAALEQAEQLLNERYLATFRSRSDDTIERAFVTETFTEAIGGYGAD